jgi:peptidoglycan/LPS O-acetylase OafA/YrhL
MPSFLNGVLLAVLFRLSGDYRKKPVIVGGIVLFLTAVLVLNVYAKPDLAIILFSLALLFTAVGESAFSRFPGSAWLGPLGNTSYAIYMLHELLIIILFEPAWRHLGLQPAAFPLFVAVCCIVLTIVAGLTYAYVENPARRMINRLAPPLPQPQIAPEADAVEVGESLRAATGR